MAVSFGCKCEVKDKSNWIIVHYMHNHSHFQYPKGEEHFSEYSTVHCLKCGNTGQTKSKYVEELRHRKGDEW